MTRLTRGKGVSRVFRLLTTSRLPAANLVLNVTANKVQLIKLIIADFLAHKEDIVSHSLVITGPDSVPVELPGGAILQRFDLKTTQEEADTILVQQVNQCY